MDNQTLFIALAVVSFLSSGALIANWWTNKQIPGLGYLAIGLMITATGIMLSTTQSNISVTISVFLSNALIMGGRIPTLIGLVKFWNQDSSPLPLLCSLCFVVIMAGFFYFTYYDPSVVSRIRLYSMMSILFSLANIFVLGNGLRIERSQRPLFAISSLNGAKLLIVLFILNAMADFSSIIVRDDTAVLEPSLTTSLLLIAAIINIVLMAFLTIIMTVEDLTVELKENAIFDLITNSLNRRTFMEVANRLLAVKKPGMQPFWLLTIELDKMDSICKQYGRSKGNALLLHFANLVRDIQRSEDIFSRFSHKEFRLLVCGLDENGSKLLLEKILHSIEENPFTILGEIIHYEAIIVVSKVETETPDLYELLLRGENEICNLKQLAL